MKLRDLFSKSSLRQLGFVLVIFALLLPVALWDSNNQVRISMEAEDLSVTSDKYTLRTPYENIVSASLESLADPGEEVSDCFDDDILRAGFWRNPEWGEYHICADLDASLCIVLKLEDGQTFVFTGKNDRDTATQYEALLTHLT